MFIPNPFHPGSRGDKIPDPDPQRILVFLTQKTDTKFSQIRSVMFIMDLVSGSQIQGSQRHRIPDPDPQHFYLLLVYLLLLLHSDILQGKCGVSSHLAFPQQALPHENRQEKRLRIFTVPKFVSTNPPILLP